MNEKEVFEEFSKEAEIYLLEGNHILEKLEGISKGYKALINLSTSKYNEETNEIERHNVVEVNQTGLAEAYEKRIKSVVDSYHFILDKIRKEEKKPQTMILSNGESQVYVSFGNFEEGQRRVAAILTLNYKK